MYEALVKSWLNKVSGRYPLLSVGESSPYNTTIILPETGPWKQGASELIIGALHMLWFHIPCNRIDKCYRVLEQAKEAASKRHHALAEEKWIVEGFALCILPIDEYCGPLYPLLDNFLKSLQESLNVILKGFLQTWTSEEVIMKLNDLNDTILEEMYDDYLLCLMPEWQIDFKHIIKDLVLHMPGALRLKVEDKVCNKNEEVTMVDDPLMQQIEQRCQWVMARKLKRKHEESDATGLVQGSDSGSMFAHEK
ncbi:hypothetical protein C8Q72DRAFT_796964 [Fomitopsis betulina]|nr:hypothetical protein C8Q72DRAFT_796964 [Fomitopsis betulina]